MKLPNLTAIKSHRWAVIIAVLFFGLTVIYSVAIPPFEMSDETRHYAVVKYMADTGRLPLQEPGEAQYHWSHEGNQPPLYYGIIALFTAPIDTGSWDDVYWYNPHTSTGVPLRTDNENMTIHTGRENFPWRGYTLAVHIGRFVSIIMAVISVIFVYLIGLALFNGNQKLAVGAMAIAAFTPMFVFISSAINNDNLVILFCTVVTWLLIKLLQQGASWKLIIWIGVCIGLGALSKLYALGMLPLAGLLLLWLGYRQQKMKQYLLYIVGLGGIVFAVAGWWYLRNFLLYGDFLALEPMRDIAGRRDTPLTLPIFIAEFEGFRIAYWALFGGVNVLTHPLLYKIMDAISIAVVLSLAILGGRWVSKHKTLSERINPRALIVILGWVGILLCGFAIWNFTQPASQGRLLFPAIAALSALIVLGLSWPLPLKYALWPSTILGGGLFIWTIASLWIYIIPAYQKPPLLTAADIPADITPLNYTFNDEIKLVGVKLEKDTIRAAETLPVTAYWEVLKPIDTNYSVFVHLYGRRGATMGQFDTYPGLGAWPTSLLSPGDVLADTYPVPVLVLAEENAPAVLQVALGLYEYDQPGFPRPPVKGPEGISLENSLAGEIKLLPWEWPRIQPQHNLDITFEEGISLQGYDTTCTVSSGPCELTLYWQSNGLPGGNYQVFVQLWQGNEQIAGFDGPPVNGDYPTNWWGGGEVIVDNHTIPLPNDLGGSGYRLRIGLYNLETGERLYAGTADGPVPDFAVDLPLLP